jgi:hypothetical protein
MTMGRKKPKSADTAGGKTPEMNVKEPGEAFDQLWRKGTKDVREAKLARIEIMKRGMVLKKQTRNKNIQPVVFLARSSAGDRSRFSQICSCVKQCRKCGRR